MLSYRHAFHAGNHADVLKHYVFSTVLHYFNQKKKNYWVIDTHAGAGMYALDSEPANKNAEYKEGIAKLLEKNHLPESLLRYAACIKSFNQKQAVKLYPGSPKIAEHFLRDNDKLRLFELHPNDAQLLTENFKGKRHQTNIKQEDGFVGIKALLPPLIKRGIILIDPPYELKQDYQKVSNAVKDSLKRFATGTYLIWYPLLQRSEPLAMVQTLMRLDINDWLNVTLEVQKPSLNGYGMYGSGLFVINPPWTLKSNLEEALPVLKTALAQDSDANYSIETNP